MYDSKKILAKTINNFKISPISDNSLSTGKFLNNQITSFEISAPCLVHVSEYVSHFCENCLYKPLCGICLQEGTHKHHIVKNVDKASKNVHRSLTQILITARAKSNLYQILTEHTQSRQTEIKTQLKTYLQTISQKFSELESALSEKRNKITKQIEQFYTMQRQKIEETLAGSREENQKLKTMIEILGEKVEKLDGGFLCIFYYEKKETLEDLLDQGNLAYDNLRQAVSELKWKSTSAVFDRIKAGLDRIWLEKTEDRIELILRDEMVRQKSGKQISFRKLDHADKLSPDSFHTTGFWTPKNISSKKVTKKIARDLIDSKKLLTLVSNDSPERAMKNSEASANLHKKTKTKPKY